MSPTVAVLFGGLAVAIVALLLIPVHVDLDVRIAEDAAGPPVRACVRWSGLAWRSGRRGRRAPPVDRRTRRPARRTLGRGAAGARALLGSPGFFRRVVRFMAEILRLARPGHVQARVRMGLDDPASTGVWFGVISGVIRQLPRAGCCLELEPDFSGPALDAHGSVRWSVRPGSVLWVIARFLASPVTLRAMLRAAVAK